MCAHDRLDSFCSFICVVKGNGGHIVMKNVCFDNSMKKISADESEFTIDCCCGTTGVGPGGCIIVRKRWVCMLKVCDCHYSFVSNMGNVGIERAYQASD